MGRTSRARGERKGTHVEIAVEDCSLFAHHSGRMVLNEMAFFEHALSASSPRPKSV